MDKSLEGRAGKPFRVVVEEGKVREFALATKSANPAYFSDGRPSATSPATFLASAAFWQGPDNSPLTPGSVNWERLLHGEQEFNFYGPPPAVGTILTGQAHIERIFEKEGKRGGRMTFAELVTEFRNDAGDLVAETRSTLIETSGAPTGGHGGGQEA